MISEKELYPYVCTSCVNVPKDLIEKVNNNIKNDLDHLKHEIKACEGIIKSGKERELNLQKDISKRDKDLQHLRKSLDSSPSLHTLEYLEEKFEQKLENLKESILLTVKDTMQNREKSDNQQTSLKAALKSIQTEEKTREDEKQRRLKNVIIHGVRENPDNISTMEKEWVEMLVKDLHVKVTRVYRIGKKTSR